MALYHEIPFFQNKVLTDLIKNLPLQGELRGNEIIPERDIPTRQTEWETVIGGRNIAPIVAEDAASPLVKFPGMDRRSADCLDIREKYAIREADTLFLRMPGERESARGREIITEQLARMRSDVETRMEKLRWDVVLTGATTVNDTVDGQALVMSYDYQIPAAQFRNATDDSGAAVWTNAAAADPRLLVRQMLKQTREANGRRIKTLWMNTNTHILIDQMEKVRTEFRSVESTQVNLLKGDHATDVIHNVRIVDYDEGYKTDVNWGGSFIYFLPDNKVVGFVGATDGGERFADLAVAPARLADGSVVQGIYAENWTQPDPTREYMRVGVVCIPRVFHRDWFITYNVAA